MWKRKKKEKKRKVQEQQPSACFNINKKIPFTVHCCINVGGRFLLSNIILVRFRKVLSLVFNIVFSETHNLHEHTQTGISLLFP